MLFLYIKGSIRSHYAKSLAGKFRAALGGGGAVRIDTRSDEMQLLAVHLFVTKNLVVFQLNSLLLLYSVLH